MRRRPHHLADVVFTETPVLASLTLCTAARRPLFQDDRCAQAVVKVIERLHGPNSRFLAFCVMPDHLHTVLLNNRRPLQAVVRLLKRRTTERLSALGVSRPIWQRGYYDHVIRRTEGLFSTVRYVLANPVRANLAERWTDYRWAGSIEWPDLDESFLEDTAGERVVIDQLLRRR